MDLDEIDKTSELIKRSTIDPEVIALEDFPDFMYPLYPKEQWMQVRKAWSTFVYLSPSIKATRSASRRQKHHSNNS